MRTIAPIMIVLVIGVSGAMIGMSGFNDAWGAPTPDTSGAQDQLDESASNLTPNQGPVEGPVSSGESSIVGLISNGIGQFVSLAGAVILLPITLMRLGFPAWFALPVGSIAYILAGVGLIQFATNRRWV